MKLSKEQRALKKQYDNLSKFYNNLVSVDTRLTGKPGRKKKESVLLREK